MLINQGNMMVAAIDQWLDGNVADLYKDHPIAQDWARISKVAEELGEAIQCYIGVTGQNPRKGVINDMDDVLEELADVAWTAILAIQHFTKDSGGTEQLLEDRLTATYDRMIKHATG